MLKLFLRQKVVIPTPSTPVAAEPLPHGLLRPESAESLLAAPRRRRLLEYIWQRTSMPRQHFSWLYRAPLERYAELVQQFPASEAHHHAYPGGMLDHGLEIVAYALKLRQSHLLPAGAPPEEQAQQAEAWTAACAYAALLHDIGKVAVDLHVEQADGKVWHPWHGPLRQPYRFRYIEDREYRLHGAAAGLLYHQLLDARILDWLCGYPSLWASLLYVLAGQYEHAGPLGELVVQADRASVAQDMGGDPTRALGAPRHALQRKLLDGLRYLLRSELKLNQDGPADGWLNQDALWLVSKTVADKLRAHLLSQGVDGIPSSNTAVFNVLQDHGMLQPTPAGKAIWRATITSQSGWSHSFTLLRLSPALVWEAAERPEPFAGTVLVEAEAEPTMDVESAVMRQPSHQAGLSRPSMAASDVANAERSAVLEQPPERQDAMADLLALFGDDSASVSPETPPDPTEPVQAPPADAPAAQDQPLDEGSSLSQPSGQHFIAWLGHGIVARRLILNDAKALVHTVADAVFLVSPGVFQRYAQEHPQISGWAKQEQMADWQWVQKRFEKLQLHRKQPDGLNIWTCTVTGPRKSRRLHGYLLERQQLATELPLHDNPYLSLGRPQPAKQ
ncbi:MobH family relaxase [Pseudomonas aeruginosa]|uniref:MobH family relaxase n=1 Tax=Pseudomonas aeruginosa TaxID=287 RepID=UPI0018C6539E|nr:TraI domain-containing protein [Pseudomonas aeruginosa]